MNVPKQKATVILLSTKHKDEKTEGENEKNEPHILHQKETQGAADTGDKVAKDYSI